MPLIPRLMWRVVRDRVAHRHHWWGGGGDLDSVWQKEGHIQATGIWLGWHLWLAGPWLGFKSSGAWELPVWPTTGFVLFNSITRQLFTLRQCRIASSLRCEVSHKSVLWCTVQGLWGIIYHQSGASFLSSFDTLKIATNSGIRVVDWWKEGADRKMSPPNSP